MRTNIRIKSVIIISSVLVIVLASIGLINRSANEMQEEVSLSFYHSIYPTDTIQKEYSDTTELLIKEIQTIEHSADYQITDCKVDKENRTIITAYLDARKYSFKEGSRPFNGISALPRELKITHKEGNRLLHTIPFGIAELRKDKQTFSSFTVENDYYLDYELPSDDGGTEILLDIASAKAEIIGLCLFNDKGEKVNLYLSLPEKNLVMDRTGSSNRIKEVPELTKASIKKAENYRLNIFVDNYSVEVFLDEGHTTISNLVFPTVPYSRMSFYAKGGSFDVNTFIVYRLGL